MATSITQNDASDEIDTLPPTLGPAFTNSIFADQLSRFLLFQSWKKVL